MSRGDALLKFSKKNPGVDVWHSDEKPMKYSLDRKKTEKKLGNIKKSQISKKLSGFLL